MSLVVACVLVRGYVGYTPEYVYRLRGMVRRHLGLEHEFVCLTDQADKLSGVRSVTVPTPDRNYPWWAKVHLFRRGVLGDARRALYLDLDSLVVDDLEPVALFPAQFALVPHAGSFEGKHGRRVVKRFNSSVMAWDVGCNHDLYDMCWPSVEERLWGDQDWIGERWPDAAAMPLEWFPRLSEISDERNFRVPHDARVVLCKKPKNTVAARRHPEFAEMWQ